jgi:mono/diheme cytochrome c family protein
MSRRRQGGALILLGLALTACSVGRPPADATGPEIYRLLCANCHGADMSGGLGSPLGPGSLSASQPDSFLEVSIMRGRGRMPSFASSLNQEQLARLIDHIREVQGQ